MNWNAGRQRTLGDAKRWQDRVSNLRWRTKPLLLLLAALGALSGAGPLWGQTNPVVDKWLQIPDTSTTGLDVRVTISNILANDFRCIATAHTRRGSLSPPVCLRPNE